MRRQWRPPARPHPDVLVVLLPTITANIISILRGGRWSESIGRYWPLVLMIPIGTLCGTWLLISVDPAPFRLLLTAIIVLHLAGDRLRIVRMGWIRDHPRLATGTPCQPRVSRRVEP